MLGKREKSNSICDLFCFSTCSKYPETLTENDGDSLKPDKLSLKKILEDGIATDKKAIKNSVSQKLL
jgi:hypothetical protein